MSQADQENHEGLPKWIQLYRYSPPQPDFPWSTWKPTSVRSVNDLPEYFILGWIDKESFTLSDDGWSAIWRGLEEGTHFDLIYLSGLNRYKLSQTWRGVEGGMADYHATMPLNKLISVTLYEHFPELWDKRAKEDIEEQFQLIYIETSKDCFSLYGVPDGAFKTVFIPLPVKNLRAIRDELQRLSILLRYPISAEAMLILQVISYIEGQAPAWTQNRLITFKQSITETGIPAYNFPVRETATDGSAAWTIRRPSYGIFITVPFAGLMDLLKRLSSSKGPVRYRTDPELRIELQPVIMPYRFQNFAKCISFFDKKSTTRCFWQFSISGEVRQVPEVQEIFRNEKIAEILLNEAEQLSSKVSNDVLLSIDKLSDGY